MRAHSTRSRLTPEVTLKQAAARFRSPADNIVGDVSFGVDLGTATCVLTAVDSAGRVVYLDSVPCEALRDGVIVDFQGVVAAINRLTADVHALLGIAVEEAATAYPPGVPASDGRACAYALEQAGIRCSEITDEVSAANRFLKIEDGVVVDVGGGSTGIGVYRDGEVVELVDIAGGGHHLDLIVAGGLSISMEEAREKKHSGGPVIRNVLRPGIEKVASRIASVIDGMGNLPVHLIGGGLMMPGAAAIVEAYLGNPVISYEHSLYVTPIGLALGEK